MASVAEARTRGDGSGLLVRPSTDRDLLRRFLEQDRLFAAYALCDLDEREFPRTRWGVASRGDRPVAVALEYTGLAPQPLFVRGEADGIAALLREVVRPHAAYLACRIGDLAAVQQVYQVEPGPLMVRMWVDRATFRPAPGATARLLPA